MRTHEVAAGAVDQGVEGNQMQLPVPYYCQSSFLSDLRDRFQQKVKQLFSESMADSIDRIDFR